MKKIIVLCALVTVVLSDSATENWHFTDDGKYYYIETEFESNWFRALQECSRHNMSLISVDSVDKHLEIYNLVKGLYRGTSEPRLWIGGHDNAVFGDFEWVATGSTFGFSNWATGEPNDAASIEHCVAIWSNAMGWNDAPCSLKLGFICEENQVWKRINQELVETSEQLAELKTSSDAQTLKAQQQELNELKESYATQANQLQQKQGELVLLHESYEIKINRTVKEKNEELDALKKSAEMQSTQLKQTQEELDLLKKSQEEEMYQTLNWEIEQQDAFNTSTDAFEPDFPLTNPNADLDTLKKCCQTSQLSLNQSLAKLEALKTSNELLANQLKRKTEELQALQKSKEMFTGQEVTGQSEILDGFNKPHGTQTNGTVNNRYYNFVVHVNENPK